MIPDFYTSNPSWGDDIRDIEGAVARVRAVYASLSPEDRREFLIKNRAAAVHASTSMEGNTMTLAQVEALARKYYEGKDVDLK